MSPQEQTGVATGNRAGVNPAGAAPRVQPARAPGTPASTVVGVTALVFACVIAILVYAAKVGRAQLEKPALEREAARAMDQGRAVAPDR